MSALFKNPAVQPEEARQLIDSVKWFYQLEVMADILTKGNRTVFPDLFSAEYLADRLGFGPDLKGMRILEIGTWDGPLAYELAQRGADVVATDIQNPDKTGFNVLGKISGIEVPYLRSSVYDLHKHFSNEFDVVLFLGVYYHLKYPMLAFESIQKIMKKGGMLHVEGGAVGRHLQNVRGEEVPVELHHEFIALMEKLDQYEVPVSMAYPGTYVKGCNWFLPNRAAMHGWLENAGFTPHMINWLPVDGPQGYYRVSAIAEKTRDENYTEHNIVGESGNFNLL